MPGTCLELEDTYKQTFDNSMPEIPGMVEQIEYKYMGSLDLAPVKHTFHRLKIITLTLSAMKENKT